MLKVKTKWFQKRAKKNSVSDELLLKTVEDLECNLGSVNLRGGLYKVRTKRIGKGKSGSYRTMVVYKESDRVIFIYGFSKSERENLDNDELTSFKKLVKDLLKISREEFIRQEKLGNFFCLEE